MNNKEKVLDLYKKGLTYEEIAKKINIPRGTVCSYVSQLIKSGDVERRYNKSKVPKHLNKKELEKRRMKYIKKITYKHKKLKEGKEYKFTELNEAGEKREMQKAENFIGKVIKEYKSHYLIKKRNYLESINKNCMIYYEIKERKK